MGSAEVAAAYSDDLTALSRRTLALLMREWDGIDPDDISNTWRAALPDAVAITAAAQGVAAEMADPYLVAVTPDALPQGRVDPAAFAGATQSGETLDGLLYLPVVDAKQAIATGVAPEVALKQAAQQLAMYVQTLVSDAGRLSTAAAVGARPDVEGYYRRLTPPSCSRCAVLAGRFYRYNAGFQRHPHCDCRHVPVTKADDSLLFDARKAIEAGKVTGLSKAETRAILDYGADPAQVVNAHRGMYTAGGMKYTYAGTSLRAVAGARLAAQELARAAGQDVRGRLFTNVTIDRTKVAQYRQLLRRGNRYAVGAPEYVYRPAGIRRLTPEQILASAPNRAEALRQLVNHGYVLDLRDTAAALARAARADARAAAEAKAKAAAAPAAKATVKAKQPNLGKFHLPSDDVADLAKAARAGARKDAVRAKLGGGQSADTELVTLPDGRKLVTKRGSDWGDKSPEAQADVRHQAEAEQLASLVGRTIGAPVVRVYRSAEDRVWMDWQEGRMFGDLPWEEQHLLIEGRDGQMLGLLDHLIGNVDRNDGNMLVHEGRLFGIDHGWSWTPDTMAFAGPIVQDAAGRPGAHFSQSREWWLDNPLTAHDVRVLRSRLEALRPNFERVGRPEWLDYTLARLDLLARRAKGTVDLIG